MQYSQLYRQARQLLLMKEESHAASLLARNLLCHVSGMTQEQLLAQQSANAPEEVCQAMDIAVKRVAGGEPLAYVLGEWDFFGMTLCVDKNVLIPRDDTCSVVELAIKNALFLEENPRILDLCTGSGCIGLAVASRVQDARVTLADISKEALAVARKNIARTNLSNRVTAVHADALAPAPGFLGKFDMIISNPPYVTAEEMEELPHSVRDFEPALALHGGEDGLNFYRSISEHYRDALKPGGYLCFEFGVGQGKRVCEILRENGFTIIERSADYNGRERSVIAQYGRKED